MFKLFQFLDFNSDVCLNQDTIRLREVVALPFSNYTDFKQKFLALKIEKSEYYIPGVTLKERTTLYNLENEDYIKGQVKKLGNKIIFVRKKKLSKH